MSEGKVVDIHVHIAGTGDSGSGCLLSGEFALGPFFATVREPLHASSFGMSDRGIEEILLDYICTSEKIGRCVLLSLDGVYKNSRLVLAETRAMTPNSYVAGITRKNSRTLFGASVHPYRDKKDMLSETDRCLSEGAVLFNWVPSVQQIDPEDDRCIPFYVRLVSENAPLLCHTGPGFNGLRSDLKTSDYGNPKKLVKALDIGVKVIVAHCGPTSSFGAASESCHFEELVEMIVEAEDRNWNLYADVSSFLTAEGMFLFDRIRKQIEMGNIDGSRLIYGSGFPGAPIVREALVPVCGGHPYRCDSGNPLDECYEVARNLGIPAPAFANAVNVLRL